MGIGTEWDTSNQRDATTNDRAYLWIGLVAGPPLVTDWNRSNPSKPFQTLPKYLAGHCHKSAVKDFTKRLHTSVLLDSFTTTNMDPTPIETNPGPCGTVQSHRWDVRELVTLGESPRNLCRLARYLRNSPRWRHSPTTFTGTEEKFRRSPAGSADGQSFRSDLSASLSKRCEKINDNTPDKMLVVTRRLFWFADCQHCNLSTRRDYWNYQCVYRGRIWTFTFTYAACDRRVYPTSENGSIYVVYSEEAKQILIPKELRGVPWYRLLLMFALW